MSTIEKKAYELFPGKMIEKKSLHKLREKYNLPNYIIENIINKLIDQQGDHFDMEMFSKLVNDKLVNYKESKLIQAKMRAEGNCKIIDKISVKYYQDYKQYLAYIINLKTKKVLVNKEIIKKYPFLLKKDHWCELKLKYFPKTNSDIEFILEDITPLENDSINLKAYIKKVEEMGIDNWLNLLFRSMGLEINQLSQRQIYLFLVRLIPYVEKNYNLIELGYRGTGKSFLYRQMTDDSILVSGGITTIANLFYNMSTKQIGLVGRKNVVAFDEVAHVKFKDETAVQILKDYMESGSFSRGKNDIYADSSIVLLGNINENIKFLVNKNIFEPLPKLLKDTAFIDRLNFYLPGWEIDKLKTSYFINKKGLLNSYIFNAFNELRELDYTDLVDDYFKLDENLDTRDIKSIKKTLSGFIKLLHPGGNVNKERLKKYLELALEGRKRIKDYLNKYYSYEYPEQLFEGISIVGKEKILPTLPEDKYNFQVKQKLPEPGIVYIGQIIENNDLALLKLNIKSYPYGKGRLNFINTYDKEIMKQVKKSFVNIKGKSVELKNMINQYDFYIEFFPLSRKINTDISKVLFIALYSLLNNKIITTCFIINEKNNLFSETSINSIKAVKIEEKKKLKVLLPIKTDDTNIYIEVPREIYENVHDYIVLTTD